MCEFFVHNRSSFLLKRFMQVYQTLLQTQSYFRVFRLAMMKLMILNCFCVCVTDNRAGVLFLMSLIFPLLSFYPRKLTAGAHIWYLPRWPYNYHQVLSTSRARSSVVMQIIRSLAVKTSITTNNLITCAMKTFSGISKMRDYDQIANNIIERPHYWAPLEIRFFAKHGSKF